MAVVEPDPDARASLAAQAGPRAVPLDSLSALTAELDGNPAVVLLGPSYADPDSLQEVGANLSSRPEIGTILVATELSTALLQTALRSGVDDVLAAPVEDSQLSDSIGRVSANLGPSLRVADSVGGAPDLDGEKGRVITVFSTKGGAGKSMLAANLGVVLAKRSEKPVVLVDADLQFGDVAVMLKLAPHRTIVDAVGAGDKLDAAMLEQFLMKHEPSGLYILPAPLEPSFADQISSGEMIRIVEILRTMCEFVIVDTPAYFNEVVLALIEESDDVLLVAGMDIPNIKNVKIGLQTMRLLNVPMQKLHLVLNRANSKVKLDVGEVERTLQIKASALVPSDITVPQSVNKGTPVVIDSPKSGVAKSIEQLANMFAPDTGRRRR